MLIHVTHRLSKLRLISTSGNALRLELRMVDHGGCDGGGVLNWSLFFIWFLRTDAALPFIITCAHRFLIHIHTVRFITGKIGWLFLCQIQALNHV